MKNNAYGFRFLSIIFLFFIVSSCGSSGIKDLEKNPPFTISEGYYQNWVAGVKEGGSGTNVYIIFKDFSEDITIQDIYFSNKKVKAKNSPENPKQYSGYFKNELRDVIMDSNPQKEAQNTPPQTVLFDLQANEAVVSYLSNGKIKFYKISGLKEKQTLAYPGNRTGN